MLETADESREDESFPDREAARAAKAESWAEVPAALVDAEVDAHLEERDGAWRWRYSRSALVAAWGEMAREAVVPPAGLPTLVLPATGAGFVSEKWLEACRAELAENLTITPVDTGHMLYLERTAEVAGHLRGFLEG
jgi:lipase